MPETYSCAERESGVLVLRITPRILYFAVAFAAGLASKAGMLTYAFAPDDYAFAFHSIRATGFITVGRSLYYLLAMGVKALGATLTSVQFAAFWLVLVAVAWYASVVVDVVARDRVSRWIGAGGAAVLAAYPYLSSVYVFRMGMLVSAVGFAAATWALLVLVRRDSPSILRGLASALIVGILCNLFQSVLLLYTVGGLAWALASVGWARESEGRWQWAQFRPVMTIVLASLIAAIVYFGSSTLVRHITGVSANRVYTPHLAGGVLGVVTAERRLIGYALSGNGALFPAWLKWACDALALVALLRWKRGTAHWALIGLVFIICGFAISALPNATTDQIFVPRVFFLLAPVTGLAYIFLARSWTHPGDRWLGIALFVAAGLFSMLSSAMFFQQSVETRWDQTLARSVFADAARQGFLGDGKLRIVTQWPIHPQVLSMHEPGVNESGFLYPWSLKTLFLVSTGMAVNVTAGPVSACDGKPRWPEPGYLFRGTDGNVYACIEPRQGFITRGYPSKTEESAFKLNYPIFRRFGPTMVRITPFFPGTSARDVSVSLAPSATHYSMHMSDDACHFAVEYALTDGAGKTMASGTYLGTETVKLPGWNALAGHAVLSVRMTAEAKNNYGCNLLITTNPK